jgi:hypothetical protein
MSNIFILENNENTSEKINIDDLYERKKQHDLNKLEVFNKILNNIHKRIKMTSRQKIDEQFCWYVVPEIIIGVPKYDQATCIAYLLDKLKENGFFVRYIHPNTFFISWNHWVPSYVRTEIKKKTGIVIDEFGNKLNENTDNKLIMDQDNTIVNEPKQEKSNFLKNKQQNNTKYTPINSYKPSGDLIYNKDFFDKIENKFK